VLRAFPGAVALLVGDGPVRSDLEHLADELHIRPSIEFLGSRSDIPELLAASDLYVHPSLQEGYSNALLEAMASACPVVATAVGGNVELVEDGVTGVLVAPSDPQALADAMLRMLGDPSQAGVMGRRARATVRARHDIVAVVREYEASYRQLLGHAIDPSLPAAPASTRPRNSPVEVNH
jgi:glycosyltransferase involved in cell wall biosynthesis